ncbi:hypothetical protein D3C83_126670 [compost metagenome]
MRMDAPSAASWNCSCFEYDDARACSCQRDGGGHAGVSRADDRYAVTQVFHAIQNLRNGVSDVRWVRTWKPSRSISASS